MKKLNKINEHIQCLLSFKVEKENYQAPWFEPRAFAENFSSERIYHPFGFNSIFLYLFCRKYKLKFNRWATFNQIRKMGYKVEKGAKGIPIVFWKLLQSVKSSVENEETGEADDIIFDEAIPFLKTFHVFNVQDIINEKGQKVSDTLISDTDNVPRFFELTDKTPPVFYREIDEAFYLNSKDEIHMPFKERFESEGFFSHVLLHELAHSTSTDKRTKRKEKIENLFSHKKTRYAYEELVADTSASYLCAILNIEQDSKLLANNAAIYVQSWDSIVNIESNKPIFYSLLRDVTECVRFIAENYLICDFLQDVTSEIETSNIKEAS